MDNVRQQALLSGLVLTDSVDAQEEPKWQETEWPPFPPAHCMNYASLVVNHPAKEQTVVVFGASLTIIPATAAAPISITAKSSTLLLNIDHGNKVWREGPTMNQHRLFAAVVVCNHALYAIGGIPTIPSNDSAPLDTIERISVQDFLCPSGAVNHEKKWTTLNCRLSSERVGCAAAVVRERFIVVAGGCPLPSVDILDTSSESQCIILSGPPLNGARTAFGMAVLGQTVYVVGGRGKESERPLGSVEYLEFDDWLKEGPQSGQYLSAETNSWKVHKDLVLGTPRCNHGVVKLGSCLIVVGGDKTGVIHLLGDPNPEESEEIRRSVEVLDTQRNLVWKLPDKKSFHNVVALLSTGITIIPDPLYPQVSGTLSLVDKNSACFARLMTHGIKALTKPQSHV